MYYWISLCLYRLDHVGAIQYNSLECRTDSTGFHHTSYLIHTCDYKNIIFLSFTSDIHSVVLNLFEFLKNNVFYKHFFIDFSPC